MSHSVDLTEEEMKQDMLLSMDAERLPEPDAGHGQAQKPKVQSTQPKSKSRNNTASKQNSNPRNPHQQSHSSSNH